MLILSKYSFKAGQGAFSLRSGFSLSGWASITVCSFTCNLIYPKNPMLRQTSNGTFASQRCSDNGISTLKYIM